MDNSFLQDFVKKNSFVVDSETKIGRRCIDGRETNSFAEALPGADAGYLLAYFSALRSLKGDEYVSANKNKIINVLIQALTKDNQKFYFHTDSHAEHDQKGAAKGCGHLRLAGENPANYQIEKQDIDAIFAFLQEKIDKKDKRFVQTILAGEHTEKAVIVVASDQYSVRAKDQQTGDSVFVFTKKLVEEKNKALALILANDFGVSVDQLEKTVWEKINQQLEATRLSLAAKLPVYEVK